MRLSAYDMDLLLRYEEAITKVRSCMDIGTRDVAAREALKKFSAKDLSNITRLKITMGGMQMDEFEKAKKAYEIQRDLPEEKPEEKPAMSKEDTSKAIKLLREYSNKLYTSMHGKHGDERKKAIDAVRAEYSEKELTYLDKMMRTIDEKRAEAAKYEAIERFLLETVIENGGIPSEEQ